MKRLLLLGGGHAHLHLLKTLAESPPAEAEVTLLSPYAGQVYSGMLPGWIGGHYQIEECVIPLRPLCGRARVKFVESAATAIDFSRRVVRAASGDEFGFDWLSIDTGPVIDTALIPGAVEHAISLRPIELFIQSFTTIAGAVDERARAGRQSAIAFVGAGAAGVEIALAMQHALRDQGVRFTLISAFNTLPGKVGPRLARIMIQRGFRVLTGQAADRIEAGRVHLQSGQIVDADHVVVATGASAAAWPRAAGLQTDDGGFILVNDCLQSVSHPEVFAVGDCATMLGHPRPKSGVYAVRAGPPLAENLLRVMRGEAPRAYLPREKSLYLISTGERQAIGSWGSWSWQGRWVWKWKDRIDRAFMAKYSVGGA